MFDSKSVQRPLGLRRRFGAVGLLAVVGAAVSPVQAQTTRLWRNPTNAAFTTTGSWVGNVVPGAGEVAQFGLTASNTPFTVTFPASTTNFRLAVTNQRPTFDLGGFTYSAPNGVTVGGTNAPVLGILNGTISVGGGGLSVGGTGGGTFGVTNGLLSVGSNAVRIGASAGTTGGVVIDTGSTASCGPLTVGDNGGTGTLNVLGPGSTWTAASLDTLRGGLAAITAAGGGRLVVTGDTNVSWPGSRQDWLVIGGGRVELGPVFRVSDALSSSIQIESGGVMTSSPTGRIELANDATTSVSVTVDGAGSLLATDEVVVNSGSADIRVLNGAILSTKTHVRLGAGFTATPQTLLVRGMGSEVIAGDFPPSTGDVSFIGYEHTNVAATVDQGGKLTVNRTLFVGHRGQGSLTIAGPGASLVVRSGVRLGWATGASDGSLTVRGGATASLNTLELESDGSGSLLVEDAGTLVDATGAVFFDNARVTVRGGAGLEFTQDGFWATGVAARAPEVRVESGGYIFTQGQLALGDDAVVPRNHGTLTLDGGDVIILDFLNMRGNGVIRGTGSITGGIFANGGLVSPGLPIGTLTANDNITFSPLGRLAIELGGTGPGTGYDRLAAGTATLNGRLSISVVNGFVPVTGQTFDIVTTTDPNGRQGQFAVLDGTDLGGGRALVPVYQPDRLRLIVDGVTGFDIAQSSVAVAEAFAADPLSASAVFSVAPPQSVTNAVTWTSDNPSVATVDAAGVIRGVGAGTTTVRGTFAGFTDTVHVTVRNLPGNVVPQPALTTLLFDQSLAEMDLLTAQSTATRTTPEMSPGELEQILGRPQNIGARIVGQLVVPTTGTYRFFSGGADLASITVDGKPVSWARPFFNPFSIDVQLNAGPVSIRFDLGKGPSGFTSGSSFAWQGPGISQRPLVSTDFVGGTLEASYFLLPDLTLGSQLPNLSVYRPIQLGMAANVDLPIFPNGYLGFKMQRFEGFVAVPDNATYTFEMNVDDAAKLWIDGSVVIDSGWSDFQFGTDRIGTRTLQRGVYPFRIDYTEHGGNFAGVQLRISSPGISEQIIPAGAFARTPILCAPDFDANGLLQPSDIFAFLNAYFAGDPRADFDGNGLRQPADIFAFLNAYFAGC